MKKDFDIIYALAVVSILGFLTILLQSFFNYNISSWVNGLIFIIIGSALTIIGSVWTTVEFSDGIDKQETANIMLTIVGVLSLIVGIIELPIKFWENINIPAFEGIKATIALFAIVFIVIETFFIKR